MKKLTFVSLTVMLFALSITAQTNTIKSELSTETTVSRNVASDALNKIKLARQNLELKKQAGTINEVDYQTKLEKINTAMDKAKALLREINESRAILNKDEQ